MSTKTRTAQTAVGDVEYETESCVNCSNEFLPEDTISIGIDLYEKTERNPFSTNDKQLNAKKHTTMCEQCAESVLGYKRSSFRDRDWFKTNDLQYDFVEVTMVLMSVVFLMTVAIVVLVEVL